MTLPSKPGRWSAHASGGLAHALFAMTTFGLMGASMAGGSGALTAAATILVSLLFLGAAITRLLTCAALSRQEALAQDALTPDRSQDEGEEEDEIGMPGRGPERGAAAKLPYYTILVPLFREREVIDQLLEAFEALDYPRAKLDIKFLLEETDKETIAALAARALPPRYELVIAPDGKPRTKPRALNYALPMARGEFVVVFDAEDRPDPDQLRKAVAAFRRAGPSTICLQARLAIDNADDSWITRLFALEYAALFDVINPGVAALGMPMLLGGTSNHFRVAALRTAGGWDAWNVTEDADLGLRLARLGYRIQTLDSTTWEEAPITVLAWVGQRSRWIKGWMQTVVTHSQHPLQTWRHLGPYGALTVTATLLGLICGAIAWPGYALRVVIDAVQGRLFEGQSPLETLANAFTIITALGGVAAVLAGPLLAMRRRRLQDLAPWLALTPLYLLMMTWAAWRALFELLRDPYSWAKTTHGLSRTSRMANAESAVAEDAEAAPKPEARPAADP